VQKDFCNKICQLRTHAVQQNSISHPMVLGSSAILGSRIVKVDPRLGSLSSARQVEQALPEAGLVGVDGAEV
jgi:hypothetical protein